MSFMNSLKTTLDENTLSRTTNGALGYASSGKKLLDMNFGVTSFRNKSDKDIENSFALAFYEDKLMAMKWLFYCRDAREGTGERRLFRVCFQWLAKEQTKLAKALVGLIVEYGRYDDLWCLLDTDLKDDVITIIKKQLDEDINNMENGNGTSLLGKWLPSSNGSSSETKRLAKIIYKELGITPRVYRKTLSMLRNYLKVVEVDMSAKRWSEIDYNAVPSKANLKYNSAFLRNDETRRREYLAALERGDKGVKINASVLFPSDIVHKYCGSGWSIRPNKYDATLEELWKSLPILSSDNTLVIRDGSGSMNGTPLEVSTALAIYMAERNKGEFHNKFITFSARPKIIDLTDCDTLHDKIDLCAREDDCSNTDIEKVFKLILNTAIDNNMSQEDMPKNVVVVSDMQFDARSHNFNEVLFEGISRDYKAAGYLLPRLVFWNVRESYDNKTVPIQQNELGVVLMSGYSTNLIKMVMNNEVDPYKCLIEQLNAERYKAVEDAVKDLI